MQTILTLESLMSVALSSCIIFALSFFSGHEALFIPIIVSFVIWTPLGLLLSLIALAKGARERFSTPDRASQP